MPFTATDEFLESWAGLIGVWRKDASPASGDLCAQFTGVTGTILPLGAALTRQDGMPYTATSEDAGADCRSVRVSVPMSALVDGADTNCAWPASSFRSR